MANDNRNYQRDEREFFPDKIEDLAKLTGYQVFTCSRSAAKALVKSDRLKTHQLRNIYSSVDRLRSVYLSKREVTDEMMDGLYLLMPKLAYAAGRQPAVNATLFPLMEKLIVAVGKSQDKEKAFRNFFAFMESVVGYHKYFENVREA